MRVSSSSVPPPPVPGRELAETFESVHPKGKPMSDESNPVLENLGDAEALEALYRAGPERFARSHALALAERPDSETLRVWAARLRPVPRGEAGDLSALATLLMASAMVAVLLVWPTRLLEMGRGVDEFRVRAVSILAVLAPLLYLLRRSFWAPAGWLALGSVSTLLAFTVLFAGWPESDSKILSAVYTPLALGSVVAVAYLGRHWRDPWGRVRFLRFTGEAGINASLVLLGGIVMTILSFALFSAIDVKVEAVYGEFVIPVGLALAPLFGVYIHDVILRREGRMAQILAGIFTPLFLVTTVGYLVAMVGQGADPFHDREFLITLNALLLVVWALTVFSLVGSPGSVRWPRFAVTLQMALVGTTLIINSVALVAFAYRTLGTGLTPNRLSAMGANVLVFAHLLILLGALVGRLRGTATADRLAVAVTCFFPLYAAWAWFNVIAMPLIFDLFGA